jgi:hypothetical protein
VDAQLLNGTNGVFVVINAQPDPAILDESSLLLRNKVMEEIARDSGAIVKKSLQTTSPPTRFNVQFAARYTIK